MKLFLIAGRAGSGKTLAAHILKEKLESFGERTVITEYSKYIKLFAKEMLDWQEKDQEKPRDFLQELGSFIREDLQMPLFFINRMHQDMKIYERFFKNVIISDVRLPEEIDEMKKTYDHVYAILIENKNHSPNLTPKQAAHHTEHALEDYQNFDYLIDNSQESELKTKITEIMEEIL